MKEWIVGFSAEGLSFFIPSSSFLGLLFDRYTLLPPGTAVLQFLLQYRSHIKLRKADQPRQEIRHRNSIENLDISK